jgi:hypothetical protein
MLDEAVRSLRASEKQTDIDACLRDAFRAAEEVVFAEGTSDDEAATGWMLVACVADQFVWVRWAGGEEALLLRDRAISSRTIGHTAANHGQPGPDVLVRGLGPEYGRASAETLTHPWKLDGGERIVVVSRTVVRRVDSHELVRAASNADVELAATEIASAVGPSGEVYAATVVFQTSPHPT